MIRCQNCDERVTLCLKTAEQFTKTEKTYGGNVNTVGERIKCRLALGCECTTFRSHSLTYNGLDDGHFEEKPKKFPTQWVENYYESEN